MTLQALFFDMGGTIETFTYTSVMRLERTAGIQNILLSAEIHLDLDTEQLFQLITTGLNNYHSWRMESLIELPTQKVCSQFLFNSLAVDQEKLATISEDLMFYIETQYYDRAMRPEIPAVLEEVHAMGLKIGLISNVVSRGQVPYNLEKYKIKQYFDPIVLSSEYGHRKPDPSIFHFAARLANVPTSACMYVGDRISRDIEGAYRAGFGSAVQIRHAFDHGERDEGRKPARIITNMAELIPLVKNELRKNKPTENSSDLSHKKIRAIFFDAGDILYFRPKKFELFRNYLQSLSLDPSKDLGDEGEILKSNAFEGQISREQYLVELLNLYGVTDADTIREGVAILENEDNLVTVFPGVRDTLHSLKNEGYLLGIITDTAVPISRKLNWFENGGFGEVWDCFISSKELGLQKPDPKIYQAALNQAGVKPENALFVGHDKDEIEGAQRVGWTTVAFNYKNDVVADYYITDFTDLLKVPVLHYQSEFSGEIK